MVPIRSGILFSNYSSSLRLVVVHLAVTVDVQRSRVEGKLCFRFWILVKIDQLALIEFFRLKRT